MNKFIVTISFIGILGFGFTSHKTNSNTVVLLNSIKKSNKLKKKELGSWLMNLRVINLMNHEKMNPFYIKGLKVMKHVEAFDRKCDSLENFNQLWIFYQSTLDSVLYELPQSHMKEYELRRLNRSEFEHKVELEVVKEVITSGIYEQSIPIMISLSDYTAASFCGWYSDSITCGNQLVGENEMRVFLSSDALATFRIHERSVVVNEVLKNGEVIPLKPQLRDTNIFFSMVFDSLAPGEYQIKGEVVSNKYTFAVQYPFTHTFKID